MSLEGRIRDLGLPEVCQLLGASRKTGTLRVLAPLRARDAEIRFISGQIADARQWQTDVPLNELPASVPTPDARAVEACVLEVLTWGDGEFQFVAEKGATRSASPVRLNVEPLLVEAAQRAEVWQRVRDRIAGPQAVPAFVDIDPQQLPLLRLVPQEWEVLTRVDGARDLQALAAVLGRSLLDVAQIVHALVGAGVLAIRDLTIAPRRHPTPPTQLAVPSWPDAFDPDDDERVLDAGDLLADAFRADALDAGDSSDIDDAVFDPIAAGVTDADGIPRRLTPRTTDVIAVSDRVLQAASTLEFPSENAVASSPVQQSLSQETRQRRASGVSAVTLCLHGDDAARHGDLAGALTCWSAALRADATSIDADRVREAIALAARLHALLHPSGRS